MLQVIFIPNKFESLDENNFLRKHKLPNLTQEETVLNITLSIKETKLIIKRTIPIPASKSGGSGWGQGETPSSGNFVGKVYQTFKEQTGSIL